MISCIHVSTPRLFHLQGSGLARCLFLFFHVSCAGLPSAARPAEDTIFMSAGLKDADSLGFMVMVVQVVMTAVSIPLMDAWPCLIGFGIWQSADTNNPETKEASCTERLVVSVDFYITKDTAGRKFLLLTACSGLAFEEHLRSKTDSNGHLKIGEGWWTSGLNGECSFMHAKVVCPGI